MKPNISTFGEKGLSRWRPGTPGLWNYPRKTFLFATKKLLNVQVQEWIGIIKFSLYITMFIRSFFNLRQNHICISFRFAIGIKRGVFCPQKKKKKEEYIYS